MTCAGPSGSSSRRGPRSSRSSPRGAGRPPGGEPGRARLTLEEVRAAIEEATKAGRHAAARAQGSQGIANCIEAGITSIEPGIFLTEGLVARMKREGIALVPTLIAPYQIGAHGVAAGIPEFMVRKSQAVMPSHVASFQLAVKAGVPVAAGTD